MLKRRIRMQGFIIFDDYGDRYPEFLTAVQHWMAENKLRYRADVVDGLEHASAAFIGMLAPLCPTNRMTCARECAGQRGCESSHGPLVGMVGAADTDWRNVAAAGPWHQAWTCAQTAAAALLSIGTRTSAGKDSQRACSVTITLQK
ncbi:MAG: hypothetical protein ABI389_11085 [Rhodanobacter sp.]